MTGRGSVTAGEGGELAEGIYFHSMYDSANEESTGSQLWCARVMRCFQVLWSRYQQEEYLWNTSAEHMSRKKILTFHGAVLEHHQ